MTSNSAQASGARTLERGLAVLEAVAAGAGKLEDIVTSTGLSRSTTHRLLVTLTQRGYLRQGPEQGWSLGFQLIELAAVAQEQIDMGGALQSMLAELAAETQDSVHIGILDGADLLCVAKARGRRGVEMLSRPGHRLKAQTTAMGKILLAVSDLDHAVSLFDPAAARTSHSIPDACSFRAALERSRELGYAIDDQENELGISCVATPVTGPNGIAVAAMSVSAPTVYMTPQRIAELVATMRRACPGIARRFLSLGEFRPESYRT
jgi:IclR family acetate operon transcriptional repressor